MRSSVRTLHCVWLLGASLLTATLLLGLHEHYRSPTTSDFELWTTRVGLLSLVLLLANLIVLWWYAELTAEGVRSARTQVKVAGRQLAIVRKDFLATQSHLLFSSRCCVVLEKRAIDGGSWEYLARNIGPGPAINVVFAEVNGQGKLASHRMLTAMAPGADYILPAVIQDAIQSAPASLAHALIGDTVDPAIRVVSVNRRDENGHLRHRVYVDGDGQLPAGLGQGLALQPDLEAAL